MDEGPEGTGVRERSESGHRSALDKDEAEERNGEVRVGNVRRVGQAWARMRPGDWGSGLWALGSAGMSSGRSEERSPREGFRESQQVP